MRTKVKVRFPDGFELIGIVQGPVDVGDNVQFAYGIGVVVAVIEILPN